MAKKVNSSAPQQPKAGASKKAGSSKKSDSKAKKPDAKKPDASAQDAAKAVEKINAARVAITESGGKITQQTEKALRKAGYSAKQIAELRKEAKDDLGLHISEIGKVLKVSKATVHKAIESRPEQLADVRNAAVAMRRQVLEIVGGSKVLSQDELASLKELGLSAAQVKKVKELAAKGGINETKDLYQAVFGLGLSKEQVQKGNALRAEGQEADEPAPEESEDGAGGTDEGEGSDSEGSTSTSNADGPTFNGPVGTNMPSGDEGTLLTEYQNNDAEIERLSQAAGQADTQKEKDELNSQRQKLIARQNELKYLITPYAVNWTGTLNTAQLTWELERFKETGL